MNQRDKIWLALVIFSLVGWALDGLSMYSESKKDKAILENRLEALSDKKNFASFDAEIAVNKRSLAWERRRLEDAKKSFEREDSARIREILQGK